MVGTVVSVGMVGTVASVDSALGMAVDSAPGIAAGMAAGTLSQRCLHLRPRQNRLLPRRHPHRRPRLRLPKVVAVVAVVVGEGVVAVVGKLEGRLEE